MKKIQIGTSVLALAIAGYAALRAKRAGALLTFLNKQAAEMEQDQSVLVRDITDTRTWAAKERSSLMTLRTRLEEQSFGPGTSHLPSGR